MQRNGPCPKEFVCQEQTHVKSGQKLGKGEAVEDTYAI